MRKLFTCLLISLGWQYTFAQKMEIDSFLEDCYISKYGSDTYADALLTLLEKAEQEMIDKQYLKSASPEAYKEFHDGLVDRTLPVEKINAEDYGRCCLTPSGLSRHDYCYQQAMEQFGHHNLTSIKNLHLALQDIVNGHSLDLRSKKKYNRMVDAISPEDFDKFVYRAPLISFALETIIDIKYSK